MKLMFYLARRHLTVNRRRTFFTLLAIVLSVAMFTAVGGITAGTYGAFADWAAQTGRDMQADMRQLGSVLYSVAAFLALVVMAGSVIVILNAFSISTGERIKQFDILKSVGATRGQIRQTVLSEGLCLRLIGIPAGLIVGFGITAIGAALANHFLGGLTALSTNDVAGASLAFHVVFYPPAVAAAVVLSFATVMLSAWLIARRVGKISAIEAIRLTGETRIKNKSVKTSRLIGRFFGFEGTLAAKSLKRSRRKYRATVVSLVTSMILVIVSAGFGQMLFSSVEILQPDIDANVLISGGAVLTVDQADALTKQIASYPGARVQRVMPAIWTLTGYPGSFAPPSSGGRHLIDLICLDGQTYDDYCRRIGVKSGSAILLDETPVRFDAPQQFSFTDKDGRAYNLQVTAQSDQSICWL